MFTAQVPVNKWYEVNAKETPADSILHRISLDARHLKLNEDSLRKKELSSNQKRKKKKITLSTKSTEIKVSFLMKNERNSW